MHDKCKSTFEPKPPKMVTLNDFKRREKERFEKSDQLVNQMTNYLVFKLREFEASFIQILAQEKDKHKVSRKHQKKLKFILAQEQGQP